MRQVLRVGADPAQNAEHELDEKRRMHQTPVHEMPDCDYEDPFWAWPNENGNYNLHIP